MGEMLVVATKRETPLEGSEVDELLCVSLGAAPATMAEGYALGREIAAIRDTRPTGVEGWGSWARLKQNGTGSPVGRGWSPQR